MCGFGFSRLQKATSVFGGLRVSSLDTWICNGYCDLATCGFRLCGYYNSVNNFDMFR